MTTNKVCGKGKCKFTDEFCASGDCPYDHDVLKNQKKINISEGNVKDDNIKSGKTKHGDFIVKYLEEGSHYKVKEINVMENVAQAKSQDLTELWKKGELEDGYYYLKDNKYTFIDYFNGVSFKETCDFEIKEVLAPVPSWEQWQQMKAFCEGFNALDVAEENRELKELLKRARDSLEGVACCIAERLVDEIDEVLK